MTLQETKQAAERTANDNSIIVQLVAALEKSQAENQELQKRIKEIEDADDQPKTA